jgi:hypothetical protein
MGHEIRQSSVIGPGAAGRSWRHHGRAAARCEFGRVKVWEDLLRNKIESRFLDAVGFAHETRIKRTMGPVSINLYDQFGLILRIETTVNDLTFFKRYREVEHRAGSRETKWASTQKTIYSLPALCELLEAAYRRYLELLLVIEDPRAGRNKLDKLSQPVDLPELSDSQVSRLIKRLRTRGLVKKVGHTYKYYVIAFGKEVVTTALKLRELGIIPQLALGLAR